MLSQNENNVKHETFLLYKDYFSCLTFILFIALAGRVSF